MVDVHGCATCGDKGIVRINWSDAPEDFALCLCMVGTLMRSTQNVSVKSVRDGYPLWMLWAERERVTHDRIVKLEDVLTVDELTAHGFVKPQATGVDAVIAAGRRTR